MRAGLHPYGWLLWLATAALPALLTHNPLYLVLLLTSIAVMYLAWQRWAGADASAEPEPMGWRAFLLLALWIGGFSIVFNGLTTHFGRIVLFRLPSAWPLIGGIVTGEAFLYGFANALALVVLIGAFMTFNSVLPREDLLRLLPRALYDLGLIVSIGVAFVPALVQSWQSIREAQMLRGYRFRGWRDYLPLFVPLLAGSFENALQLAASMEGRGFGGRAAPQTAGAVRLSRLAFVLASLFVLVGLLARGYWPRRPAYGVGLLLTGLALLLFLAYWQGRRVQRSRYRRWFWRRADTVWALLAAGQILALLAVWYARRRALIYYPYPPYSPWPVFDPLLGVLMIWPALPALFWRRHPVVRGVVAPGEGR